MDFGGNMFCLSNGDREQNGNSNSTSFAWDSWEPTTSTHSSLINSFYTTTAAAAAENSTPNRQEASLANAVMFLPQASASDHHHDDGGVHHHQQPLYTGDGFHVNLDPHLMCLKLGKRHYFEDANAPPLGGSTGGHGGFTLAAGKRGKGHYGSSASGGGGASAGSVKAAATVPRCQVEGCHVALLNAKDYHRRHKVCEMHSKAPKVVVLGLEQRFCQQCSRFHLVSEFDDSKRSCRRRLAGHNERRRKSFHDSVGRNSSQDNKLMVGGFPYLSSSSSSSGCAHSLLSSKSNSWLSPSDLSTRCSAALRELIAENRAAIMAKQINLDRDWHLQHHQAVDEEELKDIQPQSNYFLQQQQMFP